MQRIPGVYFPFTTSRSIPQASCTLSSRFSHPIRCASSSTRTAEIWSCASSRVKRKQTLALTRRKCTRCKTTSAFDNHNPSLYSSSPFSGFQQARHAGSKSPVPSSRPQNPTGSPSQRAQRPRQRNSATGTTTDPFRRTPLSDSSTPSDPSDPARFPFFWYAAGIGFFASITYVIVLFTRVPPETARDLEFRASIPADVSDRYNRTAPTFDSDVAFFESVSGLNYLRRLLMRKAAGNVLEVSCGTGRNLDGFEWRKVRTLTMLDLSAEMMRVARGKAEKLPQARTKDGEEGGVGRVRFLTQSAMDDLPPGSVPESGFDAVVQTMGICSTGDPVGLVKRMGELVNREHGVVLLLEHGRGKYEWLNRALDRWAPRHADRHGCWWNRDVERIIEESGLEVVQMSRYHLGTTYWVELRPRRTNEIEAADVER